jgi:diguanylate cyclase (GGDEF)-like protein
MSATKSNIVNETLCLPLADCFEQKLAKLLNEDGKATLVMLDLDNFMQVNDRSGHDEGDRVLIRTGEYLRSALPEGASLYRYGGDQFLIFVENESRATVELMLRRWEQKVSQISVETAVEWVTPHCSYGLSGGLMEDEGALRNHMRQADERLYEVKGERR